jgi:hypothetical protein
LKTSIPGSCKKNGSFAERFSCSKVIAAVLEAAMAYLFSLPAPKSGGSQKKSVTKLRPIIPRDMTNPSILLQLIIP